MNPSDENRDQTLDTLHVLHLSKLLELALDDEAEGATDGASPRQVLRNRLADLLPGKQAEVDSILTAVCRRDTPVAELRSLKERAKWLARDAGDADKADAVTVLYHACVAAALLYQGQDTSTIPLAQRAAIYGVLAPRFAGDPLGVLFHEAAQLARGGK